MTIYPAIDLYAGKVVRLTKGDYAQMKIYSDDPVSVAHGLMEAGAVAVHIVDLEGARDGRPANFGVIQNIVEKSQLEAQVGGGIRDMEKIEKYLSIGVKRVILGTAAITSTGFLQEAVARFNAAIAVSADIKDGYVAIKGWTELSEFGIFDFCKNIEKLGVRTLICTDISKDGLLGGANAELYKELRKATKMYLIASGGVTSTEDIETLSAIGMDGAILGKALYEGKTDLAEAIKTASTPGIL